MRDTEDRLIRYANARRCHFGRIVHERTDFRICAGAMVSDRIMDVALTDMPSDVVNTINASRQLEPDALINREARSDYHIIRIAEIAIDGVELGSGEQWRHRDTNQIFYVVDTLSLTHARVVLLKGLSPVIHARYVNTH